MTRGPKPPRCPSCGARVPGTPSTCPKCGLTFLSVCSCGSTWHLLNPRCPGCGEHHRIRKRASRRLWRSRRFRIATVVTVLVLLVVVNVYFAVVQSPRRRKYHAYQNGLAAFEKDDFSRAAVLFRLYLSIEPDSPEAHYMLGMSLENLGRTEEAVAEFRAATRLSEGFTLANVALADYHRKRGEIRKAIARAERATKSRPVPVVAWIALGDAWVEAGDTGAAANAYRRAVEMDPDRAEIQLRLGDLYRARKYLGRDQDGETQAMDRYRQAETTARQRLAGDRDNVRWLVILAKARAGEGELSDAVDLLSRVVKLDPSDPTHRLLLARCLRSAGSFEREDAVLDRALKETPTPALAIERARLLAGERHEPDKARAVLLAAIERDPDAMGLRIALAAHYRGLQQFEAAEQALAAGLKRAPDQAGLLEAEGDLCLARGDRDGAADAWRRAIAAHPEDIAARKKLIRLLLPGVATSISRGDRNPPEREEVERNLAWFLDPKTGLNPLDAQARDGAARLAFALGDYDRAAELLGAAGGRRTDPGSWAALRLLGVASLNRTVPDYARASDALYRALMHPDCPGQSDDFELAWTAAWRTGHHSREAEIAEAAVKKWPGDVEWRLRLAGSLFRDGNSDAALRACAEAGRRLAGTTDVRALLLSSRIHQAAGDLAAARKDLEQAVVLRQDATTRGALYAFLAATGDEALAEQGFRALVDEHPKDPDALLRFGDFLAKRDRKDEALVWYQKARKLDPKSREAIYRVAELKMARAADDAKELAAAEEAVAALRENDPQDPYLDYFTGKLLLLRGEWKEALTTLGRYVRKNRDDPAGLYFLAVAARRAGNLDEARRGFLAALGLDPGLAEAKLELATLYFTQGIRARSANDLEGARDAFSKVVNLDPEEPETRRFLADTLAAMGLVDEAGKEAERLLKRRPDDPGALFLAGLAEAREGDLEVAEGRFRRLVELRPDRYRGHLYLGMVLAEQRDFAGARECLRKAWQLAPGADDVLHAIVVNEIADGKAADALTLLDAERDRRADPAPVLHLLGDVYRHLGRMPEAIQSWRAALKQDPTDQGALCLAAAGLADTGQAGPAIELLKKGVAGVSRPAPVYSLMGGMLLASGDAAAGTAALRRALSVDPEFVPALSALGSWLARNGRDREAEDLLQRAVHRGLEDPGIRFQLARISERKGDVEEAVRRYRSVLELRPDDAPSMNNLALLLSRDKAGIEEALDLSSRARAAVPTDPRYDDTYGWVLYRAGKPEEATKVLIPAARGRPDDPEIQYHAGMAAYRAYRWDEARPLLKRAFELGSDFEGADEARAALDRMK